MSAVITLADFVGRYPSRADAARALGIHATQLGRWIAMGAIIYGGEIWTPAQRHRGAAVYKINHEVLKCPK